MSKIVTVHGTFASGPLEGGKWWQRGSDFTRRLSQLVEAEDGTLTIEPHVWDGHNSETSRRRAGQKLYEKLKTLEGAKTRYVVIGHSHGGSVISSALLQASYEKTSLVGLQRWVSIGTPFIKTERPRLLFSRLGTSGKAIYLALLSYMVLGALALFIQADGRAVTEWLLASVLFAGPLAIFYVVLRAMESRRSFRFNPRLTRFAQETFGDRWLSLWHGRDEAVQSLKAVKTLDLKVFPRDFAAASLNTLAIAVVPLLLIITLSSEPIMDVIAERLFSVVDGDLDEIYAAGGNNIFENAAILLIGFLLIPASLVLPSSVLLENLSMPMQLVLLVVGITVLMGFSVLFTFLFGILSKSISYGLSMALNPVTLAQLRSVAYGSDTHEETAVHAAEWPAWLDRAFPPLPAMVADDIEANSDRDIGTIIPKLRNILDSLTSAQDARATSDILAEYLTWQELIHTSYFENDRFLLLVAYAISQCEGFRPSPRFAQSRVFAETGQIYADLLARRTIPPNGARGRRRKT